MPHELHPAGRFLGTITDHGFSDTKAGSDQLFMNIENEDNPDNRIIAFLALTDAAIKWTISKLRAAGYRGYHFGDLADGKLLRGNRISYTVKHEEYDGKTSAKVGWINNPEDSAIKRSETAKANSARFDDQLKAMPPTPEPEDDKDIPF